jgi:hypothetical protein
MDSHHKQQKNRHGGEPEGVRPRRLTLQLAPRQSQVALHIVIRRLLSIIQHGMGKTIALALTARSQTASNASTSGKLQAFGTVAIKAYCGRNIQRSPIVEEDDGEESRIECEGHALGLAFADSCPICGGFSVSRHIRSWARLGVARRPPRPKPLSPVSPVHREIPASHSPAA